MFGILRQSVELLKPTKFSLPTPTRTRLTLESLGI